MHFRLSNMYVKYLKVLLKYKTVCRTHGVFLGQSLGNIAEYGSG